VIAGVGFTICAHNTSQISEPLETVGPGKFQPTPIIARGFVFPSRGGQGTMLYGKWNVGWMWA
jgi:hypothetical protein